MAPCIQPIDRTGRGYARGKIRLAPRTRSALHRRSLHAHRSREFLSAQRDRSQNARRHERRSGEIDHLENRRHQLAETFPRRREVRPLGGHAQRPRTQSPHCRSRRHRGRHVSAHHRSCQRAHGAAHRLRAHDRRRSRLVQKPVTAVLLDGRFLFFVGARYIVPSLRLLQRPPSEAGASRCVAASSPRHLFFLSSRARRGGTDLLFPRALSQNFTSATTFNSRNSVALSSGVNSFRTFSSAARRSLIRNSLYLLPFAVSCTSSALPDSAFLSDSSPS